MKIILLPHNPKLDSSHRLIEAVQEGGHAVRKLDNIPGLIKIAGVALAETRKTAESVIESFPGLQISGWRHRDTGVW